MKRMINAFLVTLLVSALLAFWPGCGGDKKSNPTTTGTGPGPTGATINVDPSNGSGGDIAPGSTGDWACEYGSGHVYIYVPTSYDPAALASPVVWLFHEEIRDWKAIADSDAIILVDLDEYNDESALSDKAAKTVKPKLEAEYNVDRARYYFTGFSAGGNIAIMFTDSSQGQVAAAMVFPGSNGEGPSIPPERPAGAKYFYAAGEHDGNTYDTASPKDAQARAAKGYTTFCKIVPGAGHYISESQFHIRREAWEWAKNFNVNN